MKKDMDLKHQSDLTKLEKSIKNPSIPTKLSLIFYYLGTLSVSQFYGSRYINNSGSRFIINKSENPKN